MEAKAAVRDLLRRLPDDCTLEDIQYHLYVLQAVDEGRAEAAAGLTVSHDEVVRELKAKWQLGADA
jgi:predicted transcriptional regulator